MPHIVYARLRDHALAACKLRQRENLNRFAASSVLTLVQMADADLGITDLAAIAKGSALLTNTQIRIQSLDKSAYREIGLVWRRGTEEFRTLESLIRKQKPK